MRKKLTLILVGLLALAQPASGQVVQNSTPSSSGTWVPVLAFGGGSVGLVCAACTGNWTVAGKRVVFDLVILLSALGSSTGAATISGLPFTSANSSGAGGISCPFYNALSGATAIGGLVGSNTSLITLYIPGAAAPTGAANTNFTASSQINCLGSYPLP